MPSLSHLLRTETAGAHERAEESQFVTELMEGGSCRGAYAMLVAQHRAIYHAMEDVLRTTYADDELLAPFLDPNLDRAAALDADLAALTGLPAIEAVGDRLTVLPATRTYVEVLERHHSPEVLLANHYVRYLGDLSGGQIVAAHIRRRYDLDPACLTFYRFDAIDDRNAYKAAYRARLDAVDADQARRRAIVDAAVESFELNRAVFADLEASQERFHRLADVT
ncbi:MAG: biliverdin-producing heme oxygenase [Actinomycetota bacterium]